MAQKFFSLEYKITEKSIKNACENSPEANADGTIDYYEANMGSWTGIASKHFDSQEEAEKGFKASHPEVYEQEEEVRVMEFVTL